MKLFVHAHASHPDWRSALTAAAAQIDAQLKNGASAHISQPTLGWIYFSDHYAPFAKTLVAELMNCWPGVAWVGAAGVGVAANGVEYFDEPALVLMLSDLPRDQFSVFSGAKPMQSKSAPFEAHTAQVHADPSSADLVDLIAEMSDRTATGYLFGGISSARNEAMHIADGVFQGGLSGVAFGANVSLVSRVTQGCQPVGPERRMTTAERNVIYTLDGEPALDCLMNDLRIEESDLLRDGLPQLRRTLVGLSSSGDDLLARPGQFGSDTRVRNLLGIDLQKRGVAIGDMVEIGMRMAFCSRDVVAARRDLVRICAEIREEIEPEALPLETALALQDSGAAGVPHPVRRMAGAVYVSCTARGGPHFGAPSAELELIRRALGDVPLVGFFAAGEIARRHLYGYTGVLTVFAG